MSLVRVRKMATFVGLVGPALSLLWLAGISSIYGAVALISMTMILLAFNCAGHLSNHADVCPKFAGISFAVSNTLATLPGVLIGPVTAHLVVESGHRWFPVFILAAALNMTAAVIYIGNAAATQVIA